MNTASQINYEQDFRPPMSTATFGMVLFVLSLAILFIASMIGYLIIRISGTTSPPLGTIDVPWMLYLSTVGLLASSVTLHYAAVNAEKKNYEGTRWGMTLTLILGVAFLVIQTPSLMAMTQQHWIAVEANQTAMVETAQPGTANMLYGLIVILIILHAVHVVGGIVPLVITTSRTIRGDYTSKTGSPDGIRLLAIYWHFLDVVWLVMLAIFVIFG